MTRVLSVSLHSVTLLAVVCLLSFNISFFCKYNSTGSVDTVPDRRPVCGHGVTPCVIHRAAANMSNELIDTYSVLEFSREGIPRYVYVATHLSCGSAANGSDSAIVSTNQVALQGKTTRKVKEMQLVEPCESLKCNKPVDCCMQALSIHTEHDQGATDITRETNR